MSRLPLLRDDELEEEQRALYRAILGGKRGQSGGTSGLTYSGSGLVGPFNAWLRSPEIGERAQRLGEALRFSSSLPPNLLEIAILVTAQHWRAQFEWWAHARFARRAGVDPAAIEAIRTGATPAFDNPDEALVFEIASRLIETQRLDDGLYRQAIETLGEKTLVDLICLLGYYGLVSMTLNVFEVPLPEGEELPFPED